MTNQAMALRRRKRAADENVIEPGDSSSTYEELRQQRIKENSEKMQKLGILDLSLKLKSLTSPIPKSSHNLKLPKPLPPSTSTRRSSRLRSVNPVDYSGRNFFTTIYDPAKGGTCHQCRRKTKHHTHCSSCKATQGQVCEICLRTRYGESVIEVNENANWVCPVCRDICNCFRCRKAKGLARTASFTKVSELGFKSVTHYLIHTEQPEDTVVQISESEECVIQTNSKIAEEEQAH